MTKDTRPRRARTPLSRERIVAAAAALLDRDGAEAMSARRLAAELGCEAMSLYHHVPAMGDLLDAVVDQALADVPLPPVDSPDPARALAAMTRDYLALAQSRPHAFRVLGTRRWHTTGQIAFQSHVIALLQAAGLSARAALRQSRVLLVYLHGAGLAIAGWALEPEPVPIEAAPPDVRRYLRDAPSTQLRSDLQSGLEALLAALPPHRAARRA